MSITETAVWRKSSKVCFYCGQPLRPGTATRDHVVPRSEGGGGGWNVVLACRPCNKRKANLPVQRFLQSEWLTRRRVHIAMSMPRAG